MPSLLQGNTTHGSSSIGTSSIHFNIRTRYKSHRPVTNKSYQPIAIQNIVEDKQMAVIPWVGV